jgi:hypothetical protein
MTNNYRTDPFQKQKNYRTDGVYMKSDNQGRWDDVYSDLNMKIESCGSCARTSNTSKCTRIPAGRGERLHKSDQTMWRNRWERAAAHPSMALRCVRVCTYGLQGKMWLLVLAHPSPLSASRRAPLSRWDFAACSAWKSPGSLLVVSSYLFGPSAREGIPVSPKSMNITAELCWIHPDQF